MNESNNRIVGEILKHLRRWEIMAALLRTVHISLGISAVVCSVLVASQIERFEAHTIQWLAVAAAVSVGLQTGFDLGIKANRMRRAWRLLNWSYLKYQSADDHTLQRLIEDYHAAEEIVGDVKDLVK